MSSFRSKNPRVDFKLTVTARMSISLRKEQSVNLTHRLSSKMSRFRSKKGLSVDFKLTVTAIMISLRKEQSVNLT